MSSEKSEILDVVPPQIYTVGQAVELIIKAETDLGYKAIVDGKYWGVLYYNEVFQDLFKNQEVKGYIKKIRDDGRLDLSLYPLGSYGSVELGLTILKVLEDAGGFLNINEKTPADEIYDLFGVSKKKYKMALGGLYKKRLIDITEEGVHLIPYKGDR